MTVGKSANRQLLPRLRHNAQLLATLAAVSFLAGCGGEHESPHTTTINAKQAAAQDAAIQRSINDCIQATPTSVANPTACRKDQAAIGDTSPTVIECGDGLSTNGSCVFAANVARAYATALRTYGSAPTGLTVTTNPVSCVTAGAGWRCHSRRSQVWVQLAQSKGFSPPPAPSPTATTTIPKQPDGTACTTAGGDSGILITQGADGPTPGVQDCVSDGP